MALSPALFATTPQVPLRTGTPFDEWEGGIPFRDLTQIRGPVASGKTAILCQFARAREVGRVFYFSPALPPREWLLTTVPDRTVFQEGSLVSLDRILRSLDLTRDDLVLIDDVPAFQKPLDGAVASGARIWASLAQYLRSKEITSVWTGCVRDSGMNARRSLSGKGVDFAAALILNLDFIVTSSLGPVVEVTASKIKTAANPEPLRLWIRPGYEFPISKT